MFNGACLASYAIFVKELCVLCGLSAIVSHAHFAAVSILDTRNEKDFHDKAHTNAKVSAGRLETRSFFHVSQSSMLFIIQEQYSACKHIRMRVAVGRGISRKKIMTFRGQCDRPVKLE
jgi:hypothetical protein